MSSMVEANIRHIPPYIDVSMTINQSTKVDVGFFDQKELRALIKNLNSIVEELSRYIEEGE